MLDSQRVTAPLSLRTRSGEPLHGLGPRRQPTHLSPTKLRYGRFSTISCAAQPSSRPRETFSRPDPGAATPRSSKSAARWCAAIATASRRSPGPPRPTCPSATSMPIELGRRSTSSTNGGRRTPDVPRPGPPRRLPARTRRTPRRRRDPQTRSPRVRVAVWLRLPQRSLPRRPPVLTTPANSGSACGACRFSPRIASHNCRDLRFSMLSHAAGGRICLTNCFISYNVRDVAAL